MVFNMLMRGERITGLHPLEFGIDSLYRFRIDMILGSKYDGGK